MLARNCLVTGNLATRSGSNGRGGGGLASGSLVLDIVDFAGKAVTSSGMAIYATNGSVISPNNVRLQQE